MTAPCLRARGTAALFGLGMARPVARMHRVPHLTIRVADRCRQLNWNPVPISGAVTRVTSGFIAGTETPTAAASCGLD